jgi:hypothetical protein
MTAERLRGCLSRLRPHVDVTCIALTGGVAIDWHCATEARRFPSRPLADVDLLAAHQSVVASSITADFLVSHFHTPCPDRPKFLIQLVDPESRLRLDVFPDLVGSLQRARTCEVVGVQMPVLDAGSILDHKLQTIATASRARRVDEKHYRDAQLLGRVCCRQVPAVPAWCLGKDEYATNVTATCARCNASRNAAFPLAPKAQILAVLGYV